MKLNGQIMSSSITVGRSGRECHQLVKLHNAITFLLRDVVTFENVTVPLITLLEINKIGQFCHFSLNIMT